MCLKLIQESAELYSRQFEEPEPKPEPEPEELQFGLGEISPPYDQSKIFILVPSTLLCVVSIDWPLFCYVALSMIAAHFSTFKKCQNIGKISKIW